MSTVSSPPPDISQTAPPPSSSSPIASTKPAAASSIPSAVPSSSSPATSPTMSSTLSVPKAAPTKPSRQATNPDKHSTSGTHSHSPMQSGHGGLPSGLPPAALNLSPGAAARLGSRSPSSIPSSPTSIHSSSSAIFERDIEPLGLPSLSVSQQPTSGSNLANPTSPLNAHRIPRSKTTEAIEMTVPSVLDSAVSALSIAEETGTSITVFSPAPAQAVHPLSQSYSNSAAQSPLSLPSQTSPLNLTFAHPPITGQGGTGSLGSASGTSGGSPSPPTMSLLLQGMGMSGLVSASASVSGAEPASGFQSGIASPLSSSRAPSPARSASPPVVNNISELTPGAAASAAAAASSTAGSPKSVAKEISVYTSSPIKRPSLPPPAPGATMPSPNMRASNRLSFISYTDLLTSAPIAAQPLSAVLSPGQNEPPTHLVVVDPENPVNALGMTPTTSSGYLPLGGVSGIGSLNVGGAGDKLDVDSLGTVGLSTTGEWGREGMGGGLEERLERLWAAEREMNERGRVRSPGAADGATGSQSGSVGVPAPGETQAPHPPTTTTTTAT